MSKATFLPQAFLNSELILSSALPHPWVRDILRAWQLLPSQAARSLALSIAPDRPFLPADLNLGETLWSLLYKKSPHVHEGSTFMTLSSVQSLSCVQLFVTSQTAARQASLSIINSWSLLRLMSIELVMPSNHLIPLSSPLCDPMDYTVHGILQARILEWIAFPFSKGSFQPRDRTQISHIAGSFFTS